MTRFELSRQFAEHMEMERMNLGLTQQQMAGRLDLSLSAYKRIINGTTDKIDLYVIYKLYLVTGKLAYEFTDISDPYLNLKKKIMGLSPIQITYIETLIDFENSFVAKHDDYEDYVTVYVPTGNMEDGMVYDSSNIEKRNIAVYRKRYGSQISCGIRITSNHLHPVYNKDDILLISRKSIRDGDTGIFLNRDTGCAYVRKFYQTSPCRLEPVNGYGETFYVDSTKKEEMDRWIKFGCVIAKIR
ncbi:MAG: helix-turn-helix domain-containing protein [Eubacteriales bacterium]|nr:helix-turn-helix domain-containing protein [Eubacteriales bacterium]